MACPTNAAEIRAGPDDYRDAVRRLRAGDTLRLAPGVYTHGLNVHRLEGAEGRPIVILGADAPLGTQASCFRTCLDVEASWTTLEPT